MMRLFLFASITILPHAIAVPLFADFIMLKDGISAETKILDTAGCTIIIDRKGASVTIKKNVVHYIVLSNDTVLYDSYVCREQKAPVLQSSQIEAKYQQQTSAYLSEFFNVHMNDYSNFASISTGNFVALGRWHTVNGTIGLISSAICVGVILGTLNITGWTSTHTVFSMQAGFSISMSIWQLCVGKHLLAGIQNR